MFSMEKRILVLGSSQVAVEKLREAAGELQIPGGLLDFITEYRCAKNYDYRKLKNSLVYSDVLVGPMPHKVRKADTGRGSSFIAQAELHPEVFPHMVELRSGHELKITRHSFQEGLKQTVFYRELKARLQ